MNAIKFLLQEHEHVRRVFKDIRDNSHRLETKRKKLEEFCEELLVHETMEQTVWYPYLEQYEEVAEILPHLLKEEKKAAKLIEEILEMSSDDEWKEKFKQLNHDVEHHASEEETKLFPRIKKIVEEEDLEEIGTEMRNFKKENLQKARE